MANIPKKFLDKLKGKNVDTSQLESLAGNVTKSDLADETKVRQLIRQLALLAGVSMDSEKEDRVVAYIRDHNLQSGDIGNLAKLMKHLK
ncbi:stage VI sporulation protein F [Aneurinibacillus sp. Ricciae_BoGa-3]|uniref:stage VI sporulation protein F n=1 Tax=Aneurinibacillus sp. Ricciae_BoGa-3 TaxID=3022697 RepID=UPI002341F4B0|nr:stage VI sporulation protein F [Aneurinibacillus sp. Ricciae_BoGa-3]WCK56069.1 stage VI sporulation protein F [Aneurinibacillus sp. Ricciae_BoGa-3]